MPLMSKVNRRLREGRCECLARGAFSLVLSLAGVALVSANTHAAPAAAITPQERGAIREAEDARAVLRLGAQFAAGDRMVPARMCVERACALEPGLLDDDLSREPLAWNELWFTRRAELRAQSLADHDAAGRVDIAVWLHRAGFRHEARTMLQEALELDPSLKRARRLADAWLPDTQRTVQLDLSYGAAHPLLPEELSDQGKPVEPREGMMLLLLPFRYDPTAHKVRLSKATARVTSDDGTMCRPVGLALIKAKGRDESPGLTPMPEALSLQSDGSPLLERVIAELDDDGQIELTCHNTTPPLAVLRQRGASQTRRREPKIDTDTGSGFAAFVVEVPRDATSINIALPDDVTASADLEFLTMLSVQFEDIPEADHPGFIQNFITRAADENPLVAAGAVAKLGRIRRELGVNRRGYRRRRDGDRDPAEPVRQAIEEAFLGAMQHVSPRVRREAFYALMDPEVRVSPVLVETLRTGSAEGAGSALLAELEKALALAPPRPPATATEARPSTQRPGEQEDPVPRTARLLTGRPASSAPPNVFVALSAALAGELQERQEQAMDIALSDATAQSLACLAHAPAEVRRRLLKQFLTIKSPGLRTSLLRVLLVVPDPANLITLLEGGADLSLVIEMPTDPLLQLVARPLPPKFRRPLIELLVRSDLSALARSKELEEMLDKLVETAVRQEETSPLLLQLARNNFEAAYQVPPAVEPRASAVPGRRSRRGRSRHRSRRDGTAFSHLLVRLATTEGIREDIAVAAGRDLVAAGRIDALREAILAMDSPGAQQQLLVGITKDRGLWEREALPMLLAGLIPAPNPRTVYSAVAALGYIYRGMDQAQQWRLNLAVKRVLSGDMLLPATFAAHDKTATLAMGLLRELGKMNEPEARLIAEAQTPEARAEALRHFNNGRKSRPEGAFAAMVFVDLSPITATWQEDDRSRDRHGGGFGGVIQPAEPIENVRLIGGPVHFTMRATGPSITAGGRQIAIGGDRVWRSDSEAIELQLDANALIAQAFRRTAEEQEDSIAHRVDPAPFQTELPCVFAYHHLGTWTAQIKVPTKVEGKAKHRGRRRRPPRGGLRVHNAVIWLEPMEPPPVQEPAP